MAPELRGFYPVTIREARYGGTYSGGEWVLIAGIHDVYETGAFASDSEAMRFWDHVRDEGPIVSVSGPKKTTFDVYVDSGDDPSDLLEDAHEWFERHVEYEHTCDECDAVYTESDPKSVCPSCGEDFRVRVTDTLIDQ